MMNTFKLLKHDIVYGTFRYKSILLAPLIFLFECLYCQAYIAIIMRHTDFQAPVTYIDYLVFLFRGMAPFSQETSPDGFHIPISWICLFGASAITTLFYPLDDLDVKGEQVIVRSPGRIHWWLSKVTWNIITTTLFFALGYFVVYLFCILQNGVLSLVNTPTLTSAFFLELSVMPSTLQLAPEENLIHFFLLPMIVSVTLNLAQMTISIVTRPIIGFLATMSTIILSTVWAHPALIGNYAMAMRTKPFLENGVLVSFGFILCLLVSFGSVMLGGFYFKTYDIFPKNHSSGGSI